jgi:hypothetical protein
MNKKKKIANKKHRKTRQRLKQLNVVSLSKMKKKAVPAKKIDDNAVNGAEKETTNKPVSKKIAAKKTTAKKTTAKKTTKK